MIIGKYICERCGKDCTPPNHLWGFRLMVGGRITPSQQKEIDEIKKEFGNSDYVLCWGCTLKVMGIKTLAEKEAEAMIPKTCNPKSIEPVCNQEYEPPAKSRYKEKTNGSNDR